MNFKALLLLGASVYTSLYAKGQSIPVETSTNTANSEGANTSNVQAQQINCRATKEIMIMADLSGLGDSGWNNNVIPSLVKFVRSFDVSNTAARFELLTRHANAYSGYWCMNVDLYANANENINSLVSTIQAQPCNVISLVGLGSVWSVLYGSRRVNTPVEVVIISDWLYNQSGLKLHDADMTKALGGVRFVCVGVGSAVDYNYMGSLCGGNIIKIANYAGIMSAIDNIANNVCNGINTPTINPPTIPPSLAPSDRFTASPTTTAPTIAPSPALTFRPTKAPIRTKSPTKYPTKAPITTKSPTKYPTKAPITTKSPTNYPTKSPIITKSPTKYPTKRRPTRFPTRAKLGN